MGATEQYDARKARQLKRMRERKKRKAKQKVRDNMHLAAVAAGAIDGASSSSAGASRPSSGKFASIGSLNHFDPSITCKPCALFSSGRCSRHEFCAMCHHPSHFAKLAL